MTVHCPSCSATVPEGKFCTVCGKPLSSSGRPELSGNVWRARPDEFAARFHVSDLEGFFRKRLTVEKGTRALVVEDGKNVGVVEPGEYTLESFLGRVNRFGRKKDITVVIVKDADIPVEFEINGCVTKEFLSIDVKAAFDLRLADAAVFVANLLGERDVFTSADVKRSLYRFVMLNLKQNIAQCGIDELRSDFSLQGRFDSSLAAALKETLEPYGLAFERVRTFDFRHEAYDELNRKKGDCYLLLTREKAEQEHRKLLDDVYDEGEMQRIRKMERDQERRNLEESVQVDGEEMALAVDKRRFQEIEKNRRDLEDARLMSDVEADERMERFLAVARRDKLLRDADLEELERGLAEKTADGKSLREHAISMLENARSEELDLARAASAHAREVQQLRYAAELAAAVDSEENRIRRAELDRRREEHEAKLEASVRDAETADRIDGIAIEAERRRHELDNEQADAALDRLARMQEMRRERKEHKRRLDREDAQHAHELKMDEAKTATDLELKRMAAMSTLSPDVLISVAPADRAALLADLQRTKALAGMTDEQILALAAEKSPAVAEALKEKFAASAGNTITERERELYDRLIAQSDAAAKTVAQAHADAARLVRETADAALDRLGQVATEQARSFGHAGAAAGQAAAAAVAWGGGAAGVSAPAAGGARLALRCPQCKAENAADARHCGNCGAAL